MNKMPLYEIKYINYLGIGHEKRRHLGKERGEAEGQGANSTTTTIKMWNQSSNIISAEDEGVTISIHNAKVDVFKDFTSLTSTTGTKIERVCTLYALDTNATKNHLFVVSVCLHGLLVKV